MEKNTKVILLVILVVVVVMIGAAIMMGVVLWQAGVYNPSGGTAPGVSGFTMVKPTDWSCKQGTLSLTVINGGGDRITQLMMDRGDCIPDSANAGDNSLCTAHNIACCAGVSAGQRFECEVSIDYEASTGMGRTSSGTVWGSAE